jgi:RNA polymerase sigma-70 factor (ECF subfamily)
MFDVFGAHGNSACTGGLMETPQLLSTVEPAQELDELALARDAAGGDEHAFDRIMRRYNQRLFRLAVSLVGEASEAEDILQESYVKAFYRLRSYTGQGGLGAWLASIVRNEAIDRLRTRRSRSRHIAFENDLLGDRDRPGISATAPADELLSSPEVAAERDDMKHILERAIASLPVNFRTVFMLREVEGLSVEETAAYLGIPAATVKTRDHRARAQLRTHLSQQLDGALPQMYNFLGERCDRMVRRVLERVRKDV